MARALSLDKTLGTSTATRLHFVEDRRVPDPTLRADSFDSLDKLVARLPAGDSAAVIDFVDRGTALPFDTLNRLRDRFNAQQVADLIGLDQQGRIMPAAKTSLDLPPDRPLWRVADAVWADAEKLLEARYPTRPGGTRRADPRPVLDAVVNRAVAGTSYKRLGEALGVNAITAAQTCDRWHLKDAYRPLIELLTSRCPELEGADWARALSKPVAARFTGTAPPLPRAKTERETAKRRARRLESSGTIAERFGVEIAPAPLGSVTIGGLSVRLLFDPRPANEVAPARHVYGDQQQIVFASTAGVGDIGKAIAIHLQQSLDNQLKGYQRRG